MNVELKKFFRITTFFFFKYKDRKAKKGENIKIVQITKRKEIRRKYENKAGKKK